MKVTRRQQPKRKKAKFPLRLLAILGIGGFMALSLLYVGSAGRGWINEWAKSRGHHRFDNRTGFWSALMSVPERANQGVEIPHLILDVKFKYMERIYHKRNAAIGKGVLETAEGDLVPGVLTHVGQQMKIKLRLKGDELDHLKQPKKWSFRIHVRGDDHVLGMRRFSLQHPATRGFQGEVLFHATLHRLGIAVPRYRFVHLTLNGDDLGVMALEEHFSKELLENNGRRESVIVRLDERLLFHGVDDYRSSYVSTFRERKVLTSEALARDYATASGLLRGFVEGSLSPSEVFDAGQLGAYLAAADLWGSVHPIRWHNMRFYLDTVTARLMPIGFDANVWQRFPANSLVTRNAPMAAKMLEDRDIYTAYRRALLGLYQQVLDGSLTDYLRAAEQEHLRVLQTEFYLLQEFPIDRISNFPPAHPHI